MTGWHSASNDWLRPRRLRAARSQSERQGGWTAFDVVILVIAFAARWELGLAFLGLKLWHQASESPLSTFAFAREKWEVLVRTARSLGGSMRLPVVDFGPRSSGSAAFDAWRHDELARIEAERTRLAAAEQDFARYRDGLVRAQDREEFERFMRARDVR